MRHFNLNHAIAIGVLVSTGVFVEVQASSTTDNGDTGQSDVVRMLDEKRVMFRDMSGSTTEAINVLRHKYGVPVSFISVADEKPEAVQFGDEELTLRNALDEFVQTRGAYTYSLVAGRLVVHPKSEPFKKVISAIEIRNKPRLDAMWAFVEHLKRTHVEFANLIPPAILGNPEAPLFAEPVSALKEKATVVEHLAALLGDNPNVMFSIVDGPRSGTRLFVLSKLKSSEAKRLPKPKDRRTTEPRAD
ncbi:MAG: hypothetical protein JSU86_05940 [Phycisphaerales bacterium]|nr:MAG: hypothetical protein JSU86_05940 [Phycisphaerales bacterium]